MQLKYNIIKMYFLKGTVWFMVSMPIIVLFFKEHGLNLTEVMLLQAIYSLSIALFEIPSGYISDIFGRKKSIVLSTILSFIGYLIFSLYSGFFAFAIAQVLLGIGGSLISGSDSALIYDTLLQIGKERNYTKIEGKNYAVGNFSEAIAGVIGGFLAAGSIYMPIYVETVVIFLSIPIALSLVEPQINFKNKLDKSFKAISEVIKFAIIDNKKLRWLIVYSSVMGVATLSMAWFTQPILIEIDIPVFYFGILWAGLNISAGITSINSYKFDRKAEHHINLIYFCLAMTVSFLALAFNISIYSLIFILFIYLIRGIVTPILRNAINQNTSSNKRATVLSIRSFIIRISFAICAPFLGFISDNYSLNFSFYLLAIIIGFLSLLSAYKLSRLKY